MKRSIHRAGFMLAVIALPFAAIAATPSLAPNHPATPEAVTPGEAAPPLPKAMQDKLDERIHSLHAELAITPAEEPQWDQFTQVMRENAADTHQAIEQRGTRLSSMNALENMQSYAGLARVHADNMQKLATSFQTLYSALSDEQKQQADAVFRHEEAEHETRHHAG